MFMLLVWSFVQMSMAAAAAYNALLSYYADDQTAAGHIATMLLTQQNQTMSITTMTTNTTITTTTTTTTNNNNSSSNFNDDVLTSNFYVNTQLDSGQSGMSNVAAGSTGTTGMSVWLISSYSVILLCGVVGNILVISTLVKNHRMRTITNLFLLNLAISDLLLGVLCIPVTLVGTMLRNFIFGELLCKLIQFLQAASVAISSWTLVAISCERYYAICHPLRSRSWQTISHAYKIIVFIWLGGVLCMTPIAVFSQLIPTSRPGYYKCREHWPDESSERLYNLLLDFILLLLPLFVLCVAYTLITRTLYVGMASKAGNEAAVMQRLLHYDESKRDYDSATAAKRVAKDAADTGAPTCVLVVDAVDYNEKPSDQQPGDNGNGQLRSTIIMTTTLITTTTTTTKPTTTTVTTLGGSSPSLRLFDASLRRSNEHKSLESKKRVIKMLFVLVLEFFICWTPLYVINTLHMFIGLTLYEYIDYTSISYLQLLAYSSSCCNPITYCFMNASFRRAFLNTFKAWQWPGGQNRAANANNASNTVGEAGDAPVAASLSNWRAQTRSRHGTQSLSPAVTHAAGYNAILQKRDGIKANCEESQPL